MPADRPPGGRRARVGPRRLIRVRRDLPVRTRDGLRLRTDHYVAPVGRAPAVLIRTPYGRGGPVWLLGLLLARRGWHVLVQSCRGTFGSDGEFEPLRHERADGLDTLEWLRRQPWYDGRLGTFGISYQGFGQWASAAHAGADLRAMVAVVTAAQIRDSTYAGGSFSLDTILTWAELLSAQRVPWLARRRELLRGQPRLRAGLAHLPLAEADRVATGAAVPFFQQWLDQHQPGAAYWRARTFHREIAQVRAPVSMVTGWHDIFLTAQLADYAALRAAGRRPALTIGPWTHGSPGLFRTAVREAVSFFGAHLDAEPASAPGARARPAPVRVHVAGAGWRHVSDWPPPATPTRWCLWPGGRLDRAVPPVSAPDQHGYDPADPTPSVGGALLVAQRAGVRDNRALEARADVLTYTSAVLDRPLEVIGPVTAEVFVRGELPHFDVFVRLCRVDRWGRSWNVCDGLTRVDGGVVGVGDGVRRVQVALWPTACRFGSGDRLRVQVSGGAHPRWARNPGTGEPLGRARTLRAGRRWIFHDPARSSALWLPVTQG
ncbi:CocE/NonD family hydrolase [Micromonospora sp. LOL_023]|uniref:CocE/NonD family hydrolase n=1 Tax=Micromonospora sp. LOL_023 TaxID=3345418 RepID=UPI003A83CAFE